MPDSDSLIISDLDLITSMVIGFGTEFYIGAIEGVRLFALVVVFSGYCS